jgi:hypothetical protein
MSYLWARTAIKKHLVTKKIYLCAMVEMPSDIVKRKVKELAPFLRIVRMINLNGLDAQIFRLLIDTHNFQPEGLRNKDIEAYMEGMKQQDVARSIIHLRREGLITTSVNIHSKRERNHSIDPRIFEVMMNFDTSTFVF